MNEPIPLGQPESQHREFKSKDVLKHLPSVSREVVGMLNAAGGEIWIGLAEEQGRATRVEAIENPTREVNRLRDHLSDAIEPSPTSREIAVNRIPCGDTGELLKIRVKPTPGRAPYALREGTGRHFLKRVHDRLRPMSREEILTGPSRASRVDKAYEIGLQKILEAREQQPRNNLFWLRVQPVGDNKLELNRGYHDYFINPLKTGNRVSGWTFVEPYGKFEPTPQVVRHARDGGICTEVFRDGAIQLTMPIANLYYKTTGWPADAQATEIWPYALLEYPASVFRLASTIYREHQFETEDVLADLALFGIRGWTLRPHSPVSFNYKLAKAVPFKKGEDLVTTGPLKFSFNEIQDEPDRCAFRLVQSVYEAFDLFEEDMPPEFDRESGRLILPGA